VKRVGRPRREPPRAVDLGHLAVAQLAHDLEHQLSVVTVCTENLARLLPPGQGKEEIAELRRCAYKASLLASLIVRPDPTHRHLVDLNAIVVPVSATLSQLMGGQVLVKLQLATEPAIVLAEPAELESILLNLVLNARNAMPAEGVLAITTSIVIDPRDSVGELKRGTFVQLTVADTGHGGTPELEPRRHDPLFSRERTGAGLGLNSVAYLVGQLGGTLSISSAPNRGTSATVTLPIAAHSQSS
jgi:two-component system cell cycle sensor histidine kinase/response regulator CckA